MAATLRVPTIFTAVDKMSSVVKTISKSVSSFSSKAVSGIKRFDQKMSSSFKKLGKLSQLAIGVGAGALFREVIQGNIAFNDSLASVSAITGSTGNDLIKLEMLAKKTAKVHSKAGADVLKAYELVGSAKPELLGNLDALDAVTNSVIVLAKASRMDLETSALSLTGVMNQFALGAENAGMAIDVLAAGAKFGASAIPDTTEAILKFGTGAKAFNVDMADSVALVQTFAAKGIKGAEAGTKLRNILTKMSATGALPPEAIKQMEKYGVNLSVVADKTIPLSARLKELSKIAGDSTALVKVFGLENKEAGQVLLNNIPLYDEMNKSVRESGVAASQAATNTNTLKFLLESIKTSFINATTATNGNSKALDAVKSVLSFVADNMETVVGIAGVLLGSFIAMKVVVGIMQAIEIATKLWTAAQWLLNIAMDANPVGLIILGVAALIGLVALIVNKFDSWGASLTLLLGPIGFIISAIMTFRKRWDEIKEAFSSGGILEGLKAIGRTLIEAVITPMESLLRIVAKIPGLGGLAEFGLGSLATTKQFLGIKDDPADNSTVDAVDSPSVATSKSVSETIRKNNVQIDINDPGNNVAGAKSNGDLDIPINISKTQGSK